MYNQNLLVGNNDTYAEVPNALKAIIDAPLIWHMSIGAPMARCRHRVWNANATEPAVFQEKVALETTFLYIDDAP